MSAPHRSIRRRYRLVAVVAAMVAAVGLFSGWTGTAGAAGGDALQIRRVDTTQPAASRVQFLFTGDPAEVKGTVLTDGGTDVTGAAPTKLADTDKVAVALVFDVSNEMDQTGALVSAKDSAKAWLRGRTDAERANQLVAVYTSSDKAVQIQTFTADTQRILAAIDRVAPPAEASAGDKSALWGAIRLAGDDLAAQHRYQANILVMAGKSDNVTGDRSAANGAVANAGASVFAAELLGHGLNPGSLDSMVRANGGLVLTTDTGTDLGSLVGQLGTTIDDKQFTMTYASSTATGSVADLSLQVGDQTAAASVVVGSDVIGATSLAPEVKSSAGGISALQGPVGLALMIIVAVAAGCGLAYGAIMVFVKEDRLSSVLQPYDEALVAAPGAGQDDEAATSLARTALVQRAVELTEQVAGQRGVLASTEAALERANLPLRAGEALFFYAAIVVVATLLSLVVTGSVLLGLIVGLLAALLPVAVVNFLASRRRKAFMALLPDTLSLLAGTLRAGYSLMQGVEAVSQEVAEPMGLELRRVVTEARLGRPLEEALDGVAERMASDDFAWAVMAIRIQREVGGNLSELLLTVADTMVARERLRRDVAALTAEGRMSAYILIALPVGLGGVMFMMNREYTSKLLNTTLGNVLLAAAVVSAGVGFMWMRKIINIRI